ncbi:MAG: hypothetical protein IJ493_10070 [Clostridia bacterium]|nr:hypothetical protein [Clostridia bacterium]
MRKLSEYSAVYSIGAAGYSLLEILWRGFTHWTMALTGGLCFLLIYITDNAHEDAPLWKKCLAGSLIITFFELLVGIIVNIILHWDVWDYSSMKFNLWGQICPLYSALWYLLCMPAAWLCRRLKRLLGGTTAIQYGK